MTIAFNEISPTLRIPIVAVEFDSSKANQGPKLQEYRGLLIGQKTTSAPEPPLVVKGATSADQVGGWFGFDSQIYWMARRWFDVNKIVKLDVVAVADPAGSAASGTFTVGGAPTAAGTLYAYVCGARYQIPVTTASTPTTIAAALVAAIQADPYAPVSAANVAGVVTCTAINLGVSGNDVDLRVNYQTGEELPKGVTCVVAAMSGGTGSPVITAVWPLIVNDWYNILAVGFNDQTTLTAVDVELADRWSANRMMEGVAFFGARGTHSGLTTLGNANNSKFTSIMGAEGSPSAPWEWGASVAGVAARYMQTDPGRPLKTLALTNILAPKSVDLFTPLESNLLLFDGISVYTVDAGGTVRIWRAITTYQTHPVTSAPDATFLDVMSPLTLGYIRFDSRASFGERFPRHKLGDDGNRFGSGQAIITPSIGRAFFIARARIWEELALIENVEQFKRDLVVERNATDRNRLDFLLPPDLINQLQVVGVQIGFIL